MEIYVLYQHNTYLFSIWLACWLIVGYCQRVRFAALRHPFVVWNDGYLDPYTDRPWQTVRQTLSVSQSSHLSVLLPFCLSVLFAQESKNACVKVSFWCLQREQVKAITSFDLSHPLIHSSDGLQGRSPTAGGGWLLLTAPAYVDHVSVFVCCLRLCVCVSLSVCVSICVCVSLFLAHLYVKTGSLFSWVAAESQALLLLKAIMWGHNAKVTTPRRQLSSLIRFLNSDPELSVG